MQEYFSDWHDSDFQNEGSKLIAVAPWLKTAYNQLFGCRSLDISSLFAQVDPHFFHLERKRDAQNLLAS